MQKAAGKAPASLWKTKGSLLIAWINSKQVSAHFIRHLPSHPSTFICHITQPGPFRGPGTIVCSKLGFSKRPELFLSCLDKTGWLKRGREEVLAKRGPQLASKRLFASSLYHIPRPGELGIVAVPKKVCRINSVFIRFGNLFIERKHSRHPVGARPVIPEAEEGWACKR